MRSYVTVIGILAAAAAFLVSPVSVSAERSWGHGSNKVTHLSPDHFDLHHARRARTRSAHLARAHLGYPNVFQESRDRSVDYAALSHQIARLGELIARRKLGTPAR